MVANYCVKYVCKLMLSQIYDPFTDLKQVLFLITFLHFWSTKNEFSGGLASLPLKSPITMKSS